MIKIRQIHRMVQHTAPRINIGIPSHLYRMLIKIVPRTPGTGSGGFGICLDQLAEEIKDDV